MFRKQASAIESGDPTLCPGSKKIQYSLVNTDSSRLLQRTMLAGSGRKIWTVSFWIKKDTAAAGANQFLFTEKYNSTGPYYYMSFNERTTSPVGNDWYYLNRNVDGGGTTNTTNCDGRAKMLDIDNEWHHVVTIYDSTHGTASQRLRLYLDGVKQAKWNDNTPTLNELTQFMINKQHGGIEGLKGKIAEVHVVDGTALEPNVFGQHCDITGRWEPIEPNLTTAQYGVNGFYWDFADASDWGKDVSGKGNHWTTLRFNGASQSEDTPTNRPPKKNIKHSVGSVTGTKQFERVPASGGDRKTFTLSCWYKPMSGSGSGHIMWGQGSDTARQYSRVTIEIPTPWKILFNNRFWDVNDIFYRASETNLFPAAEMRWFHFLFVMDMSNPVAADRHRFYVDGLPHPSVNDNTTAQLNKEWWINAPYKNILGSSQNFYYADFHFIDGQAVMPDAFIYKNEETGLVEPIEYKGEYGQNGYHLDLSDPSDLGKDVSGNNNNWNVIGYTSSDVHTDTPTNPE